MSRTGAGFLVLIALAASMSGAAGQADLSLSAGAGFPLGDFGDVADVGFQGAAIAAVRPGSGRLALAAKASYGRAPHAIEGDRSDLVGLSALARYPLIDAEGGRLSALWGAGVLWHSRRSDRFPGLDATRVGAAVDVGLAASRPVGGVRLLVSLFYTRGLGALDSESFPTELMAASIGITVPLTGD